MKIKNSNSNSNSSNSSDCSDCSDSSNSSNSASRIPINGKYYCVAKGHIRGVFETHDPARYEEFKGQAQQSFKKVADVNVYMSHHITDWLDKH